jgi:hypothetical protein
MATLFLVLVLLPWLSAEWNNQIVGYAYQSQNCGFESDR